MPVGADPDARWCSGACRRAKLTALDRELESRLRERLAALSASATLCPSEIARQVGPADSWRELMEHRVTWTHPGHNLARPAVRISDHVSSTGLIIRDFRPRS
ncbi:DUF3253 domain-containing protein [Schumannella luteola]|uniref:DUF3253 domain-containing protein n=1 Tax=Schumannella luteola TaxID=472059 RepID=UPI00116EA927|nr:DUF3253 domain-containing protein [Schumannella luteola]